MLDCGGCMCSHFSRKAQGEMRCSISNHGWGVHSFTHHPSFTVCLEYKFMMVCNIKAQAGAPPSLFSQDGLQCDKHVETLKTTTYTIQ